MRQRKMPPDRSGFGHAVVRRCLAAGLVVWLLALQAPLPVFHLACLADGEPPAGGSGDAPFWSSRPPAAPAHDASNCLICQAFCQLARVLVSAVADCQSRPAESPLLVHLTPAPPAEAPCPALAAPRAPPAFS
mgnify:CR=1 FL=1